jgi:endonuclease/exonuclease/phosphatase family metal-dependent hydrolase
VLTYNILQDGLFHPERIPAFRRLLQAIDADIIGFQEFDRALDGETRAGVRSLLPVKDGGEWSMAKVADNVAVTRYPILRSAEVSGNGAFLVDLSGRGGGLLLLIVAHPPCCDRNEARQAEIDALMGFVRDTREGDAALSVPEDTPILIVGDMNLVGYARQLKTLLEGEIVSSGTFGPAFAPDWDGTGLADAVPRHLASPMAFTWYGATSSFTPGRLDYIVYTDSVLRAVNRFVLFTPEMPREMLASLGLQSEDTSVASDHLPVVCDFDLLIGR